MTTLPTPGPEAIFFRRWPVVRCKCTAQQTSAKFDVVVLFVVQFLLMDNVETWDLQTYCP